MQKKLKVIIAGSRSFNNYELLKQECDKVLKNFIDKDPNTDDYISYFEVVSGCAKGADQLGERYADERNADVKRFPAKWKDLDAEPCVVRKNNYGEYNALAGINRNEAMATYTSEDGNGALILFWDGSSVGSFDMKDRAQRYGLKVKVVRFDDDT